MRLCNPLIGSLLCSGLALGLAVRCNLAAYKPVAGIVADALTLTWQGEAGAKLHTAFGRSG